MLKKEVGVCELHSAGSGGGPVTDCLNMPCSLKGGEFLDQRSVYQLLKRDPILVTIAFTLIYGKDMNY
jgi:hypothetical protein